METLEWRCKAFAELDTLELYRVLEARCAVFVVEQRCVYADIDGLDVEAVHLFAIDNGAPDQPLVACARLFAPTEEEPLAQIGRVLTAAQYREHGIGRMLMQRALDEVARRWPHTPIRLNAQQYLRAFYESFGFKRTGGPYLEDGIPHIEMRRAPR
ncbi:GNAT family N-acetyltransferase [Chitinasiproducens palmae]|nr:GNAT family N-acetyltransferase [Chitinasiproducens palmae]